MLADVEGQPEPVGPALGDPDLLGACDAGDVVVLDPAEVPHGPRDGVGLGVGSPGQVVVAEAGDDVRHLLADAAEGVGEELAHVHAVHPGTGRRQACHAARVELVWALPAVLALVDWYAVARGDRRTETWAKPAVLAALIVTALVLGATETTPGLWLLLALALGLVGDVFLLGDSDTRFRLGLAAFLVGHLGYVVCFATLGLDPAEWAWVAWVVLLVCLLVTRQVAPATYMRGGAASPCRSRSTRW